MSLTIHTVISHLQYIPFMKLARNHRYNHWMEFLLFSGMGCFSYLFLVIYTDLQSRTHVDLTAPWAFLVVVFVFNCIGFSIMQINRWWKRDYMFLAQNRRRLVAYYVLMAASLFLLNYLLLVTVKWTVNIPQPWHFVWSGVRMLAIIWLVELVVVSLTMANSFYRHLIVLYRRNMQLEESSVKAQYTALQSQLNPHFLFNSLNTLISEIRYSPANAELFTQHLSDVYRYILRCQEQRVVTLRSELGFLDSYIFLHQVRLGDCIHIDNQVPECWWESKIPPLTLQLLAENVIKHNTIHGGKPMTIRLTYSPEEGLLIMENRISPKKCHTTSGVGLKNLSARYKLIYNQPIIISTENEYFTVKCPLINE